MQATANQLLVAFITALYTSPLDPTHRTPLRHRGILINGNEYVSFTDPLGGLCIIREPAQSALAVVFIRRRSE